MLSGLARSQGRFQSRDFESVPWCYVLWCAPAVMAGVASVLYGYSIVSYATEEVVWTLSVLWIGAGCFINGRSCGRLHCTIDGIAFPVLSLIGVLIIFSIAAITWTEFWLAFFVILAGGFAAEWHWGKYRVQQAA